MAEHEFKLDTRFSDRPPTYLRPAATIFAVIGITVIILTMTTGLASRLLPMEDKYLAALIPQAPDGAEPLSLQTLEHEITDNILTVKATVFNRTEFTISGLQAVVDIHDKFGFTTQSVAVPLEPKDLPSRGMAAFQTTITLTTNPLAGYAIRFQLADGPFVPHKDERPLPVVSPLGVVK